MMNKLGKLISAAYGPVPLLAAPAQEARDGEDYAVFMASVLVDTLAEHMLFIDCEGTIRAASCRQSALSARNLRAHLWHNVGLTWEDGPPVQKTKGHTTKTDIDAGRGT